MAEERKLTVKGVRVNNLKNVNVSDKIKEIADAEARRKTADDNLAKSDAALTQAVQKANVDEANVELEIQAKEVTK